MADKSAIAGAIIAAVEKAAADPGNGLQIGEAGAVAAQVTAAVAPVVDHLTNVEPWFRSRVAIGSIAGMLTSGMTIYGLMASGVADSALYTPPIGGLLASGFALYGRLRARKPLGK